MLMPGRSQEELANILHHIEEVYWSNRWSLGQYTEKFEELASKELFDGKKRVLLVGNGTEAIELALVGLGSGLRVGMPGLMIPVVQYAIEAAGDDVILLDVDRRDMAPQTEAVERAIEDGRMEVLVWVHTGGVISTRFREVKALCDEHQVLVVEDISHAYNSVGKDGLKPGELAPLAAGSLYVTKNLACGEAGIVACEPAVYEQYWEHRNQGKNRREEFVRSGYNFRTSEWQAAVAYERLKNFQRAWEEDLLSVGSYYDAEFVDTPLWVPHLQFNKQHSFYKYVIITEYANQIEQELKEFTQVPSRVYAWALSDELEDAVWLARNHVCLPLDPDVAERVVETVKRVALR